MSTIMVSVVVCSRDISEMIIDNPTPARPDCISEASQTKCGAVRAVP